MILKVRKLPYNALIATIWHLTCLVNSLIFVTGSPRDLDTQGWFCSEPIAMMSTSLNSTYQPSVLWWEVGKLQILLYSTIFLLAVVGNCLVILTLIFNQTMRTITNVFLLNLAVSDLLLGVLCMPFTLVGTILRDFVFGDFMCKLIPFLQG
ncbi:hypothetical protein J6590_056918 [Homalodisca vitripennis]|nr:hypothetical protein J6590_056918 [Homalodisca vitripennis]